MTELTRIAVAPGLVFDVLVAGPAHGPLVLLLHGFAESFHTWRAQIAALAAAGYRAVAPSQRGYSPGARPDPADASNYEFDRLIGDAMNLADACGATTQRFHLIGHDWGGSLSWAIADRHAERLASLTVLSRPHPNAFNRALAMPDGDQARRSAHHKWLLEPEAVARLLANDVQWLRDRHIANGVSPEATERHIAVIGNEAAMTAAVAWYRARTAIRSPLGVIRVPTLYIWGDADDTVGRAAAEGTADFAAAPYRFEALPGGGHFTAEQLPERVAALVLEHLRNHP